MTTDPRPSAELDPFSPAWEMLQALWGSAANMVVAPMQDFLSLGTEGRMNYPGTTAGNWRWRLLAEQADEALQQRIAGMNRQTDRHKDK